MNQAFTIYFFRDNSGNQGSSSAQDQQNNSKGTTRVSSGEGEEEPTEEQEEVKSYVNRSPLGIMATMPRPEYDVLMDRIQNDLVAFGEFQASEIV